MEQNNIQYKVVEHFVSINGEGTHAGQLAMFIRFQGCNLNCSYCDTKWANEADAPFQWMTAEELVQSADEAQVKNITLTGGEPLLQKQIEVLIATLLEHGMRVEIETNGTQAIKPVREAVQELLMDKQLLGHLVITLDYKLGCSGMEAQMNMDNYAKLQAQDTVKFVSGSRDDLVRAKEIIDQYELVGKCHIYLSPVFGQIEPAEMVEFMKEHQMNGVNLQLQLHKFIWNPEERGV